MARYLTVKELKAALAKAEDHRLRKIELRGPDRGLAEIFWVRSAGAMERAREGPKGPPDTWIIEVVENEWA
jgi:hypothetical protein